MARLEIESGSLVVVLSPFEKLGAMRGSVRVPLAEVHEVRTTRNPWSELRGWRAPGTGIPGVIALGVRRGQGFCDFAAVYGKREAVVVGLAAADFDRLIVSCPDAPARAAAIRASLAG